MLINFTTDIRNLITSHCWPPGYKLITQDSTGLIVFHRVDPTPHKISTTEGHWTSEDMLIPYHKKATSIQPVWGYYNSRLETYPQRVLNKTWAKAKLCNQNFSHL